MATKLKHSGAWKAYKNQNIMAGPFLHFIFYPVPWISTAKREGSSTTRAFPHEACIF